MLMEVQQSLSWLALSGVFGEVVIIPAVAGQSLYQLPPNFRRDDERLKRFLFALPAGIRCAFEFRHDSWHCRDAIESFCLSHHHFGEKCVGPGR